MAEPVTIIAVAGIFVLAGLVKGVIGMGLPTVAMGLLGGLIAPPAAAALLVLPSLVTNLWQLVAGPALGAILRRLGGMMAGVVVGTFLGLPLLAGGDTQRTTAMLGAALALYAAHALLARPLAAPARAEPWLSPLVGLATGVVTGATGVFVIPAVPWLQSLRLEREALIQALGLSFTVSTLALATGLWWHGAFAPGQWGLSALAILPALLGMAAGQWLRQRISPAAFRRGFLLCLLALGLELASRPFR